MHSLDPKHLLDAFGVAGLLLIIFAESGLLIGLVFPGDSLLFSAGLFASQHRFGMTMPVIVPGCLVAAIAGSQAGFVIGRRVGPRIFRPRDAGLMKRLFKADHVERANAFFDDHGPKAVVLARFVPIVRTLAPVLAGVGDMDTRVFTIYNAVGGALWSVGVLVAGYALGKSVPNIDHYLLPIVAAIIVLSALPPALEMRRQRRRTRVGKP